MKQYNGSVIIIRDNQAVEIFPFVTRDEAGLHFLCECKNKISNFDEYTSEDIAYILENGFERFGDGSISIVWF